jgi:hypothetical protein
VLAFVLYFGIYDAVDDSCNSYELYRNIIVLIAPDILGLAKEVK